MYQREKFRPLAFGDLKLRIANGYCNGVVKQQQVCSQMECFPVVSISKLLIVFDRILEKIRYTAET